MIATHDVELAARCATRVVVLGDGEVVADGPARDVLAGSLFAPQVLRVLPPFLTVAEVEAALAREASAVTAPVLEAGRRGARLPARHRGGRRRLPLPLLAADRARSRPTPRTPATRRCRRARRAARRSPRSGSRSGAGTMTGSTVALLGVLAAMAGMLKLLDLPGGGNGIFFLVSWAAPPSGPASASCSGLAAMAVSAVITGGIGPWLPFQMLALAWMGAGAGWLGRLTRRLPAAGSRSLLLAAYGWVWGFVYGAVMNLWFWPLVAGEGELAVAPRASASASTLAALLVVLRGHVAGVGRGRRHRPTPLVIVLVGRPVLRSLRRFAHRLDPVVELVPVRTATPGTSAGRRGGRRDPVTGRVDPYAVTSRNPR